MTRFSHAIALLALPLFALLLSECNAAPTRKPTQKPTAYRAPQPLAVTVAEGLVQGIALTSGGSKLVTWRGLRYAKAPVGDLRWADPLPAGPYSVASYDATIFRPSCMQESDVTGYGVSEDCLFLNVVAPDVVSSNTTSGYPVIFNIHSASAGSGANPLFAGSAFLRQSVIVVTPNYRLGVFGFLKDSTHTGNYGIKDLVQALKWVKTNIKRFGGDPARVTLLGQGSGARSMLAVLQTPSAAGLFRRAILQSASIGANFQSETDARWKAATLFSSLNKTMYSSKVPLCYDSQCLAHQPAELILANEKSWRYSTFLESFPYSHSINRFFSDFTGATLDSVFLPLQPLEAFKTGRWNKVTLLLGNVKNEGISFVYGTMASLHGILSNLAIDTTRGLNLRQATAADYLYSLDVFMQKKPIDRSGYAPSAKANEIAALYSFSTTDGRDPFAEIVGDIVFRCSARNVARLNPTTTVLYEFRHVPSNLCSAGGRPECFNKTCNGADASFAFDPPVYSCIGCRDSSTYAQSELDSKVGFIYNRLMSRFSQAITPSNVFSDEAKYPADTIVSSALALDTRRNARCDYWDRVGYSF